MFSLSKVKVKSSGFVGGTLTFTVRIHSTRLQGLILLRCRPRKPKGSEGDKGNEVTIYTQEK